MQEADVGRHRWQAAGEGSAALAIGIQPDVATHLAQQAGGDIEPKAGAFNGGGVAAGTALEDRARIVRGNTGAHILDDDSTGLSEAGDAYEHKLTAVGASVGEDVAYGL